MNDCPTEIRMRGCLLCGTSLPVYRRSKSEYCSSRCRDIAAAERRAETRRLRLAEQDREEFCRKLRLSWTGLA